MNLRNQFINHANLCNLRSFTYDLSVNGKCMDLNAELKYMDDILNDEIFIIKYYKKFQAGEQ